MASQPIILLAKQRSGTTVFRTTLAKTNVFDDFGEIFHPNLIKKDNKEGFFLFKLNEIKKDPIKSIVSPENQSKLFKKYINYLSDLSVKPYYIIDAKYNAWHHFNTYWFELTAKPNMVKLILQNNIKVIHLIRENVFEQYVSSERAIKSNQWHIKNANNELKNIKIDIDKNRCFNMMRKAIRSTQLFRNWFKNYPNYIEMYYENLYEKDNFNQTYLKELEDFTNTPIELTVKLQRGKIIKNLNDLITNKIELIDFFKNTNFGNMVEDSFK